MRVGKRFRDKVARIKTRVMIFFEGAVPGQTGENNQAALIGSAHGNDAVSSNTRAEYDQESAGGLQQNIETPPVPSDVMALRQYGEVLVASRCVQCQRPLISDGSVVVNHVNEAYEKSCNFSSFVRCRECTSIATCVGCGAMQDPALPHDESCSSTRQGQITRCCDAGVDFQFWALCCGLDYEKWASVDGLRARAKGKEKDNGPQPRQMYTVANPPGTGYSMHHNWLHEHFMPKVLTSRAKVEPAPGVDAARLQFNIACMSSMMRGMTPTRPLAVWMLARSPLLDNIAELLRDDIFAAAKNPALYAAVTDFIKELVHCQEATALLVTQPRTLWPKFETLIYISLGDERSRLANTNKPCHTSEGARESGQSLKSLLDKFSQPYRTILQREKEQGAKPDEYWIGILTLARKAVVDTDDVEAQVEKLMSAGTQGYRPRTPGSTSSSKAEPEPQQEARETAAQLQQWYRETCVREVDDAQLQRDFVYTMAADKSTSPAPGRMRRIWSELAALASRFSDESDAGQDLLSGDGDLAETTGIYVRYASTRPDMIKALIAGPRGTPYERGLFEFDMLLPVRYPEEPPRVTFRTTSHGHVRFNPNLYADGTVCLSLLGTWQGNEGEMWTAESNLYQLLISIQAMILCDEPYYNEPGRTARNEALSNEYNLEIGAHTTVVAQVGWLAMASATARSVWADILCKHFTGINLQRMAAVADKWQEETRAMEKRKGKRKENRKEIQTDWKFMMNYAAPAVTQLKQRAQTSTEQEDRD